MVPLIATLLSGAFSLASNRSQWNQQQRALAAQKKENEKMREYNMQLAQQQNQWNLEQWQRENEARKQATADERAYNSPSAQKARLMAAGLNPDMMYGQGGVQNTSTAATVAASPEMSAGAPATPMDWSSLANRRTIGDTITNVLNQEYMRAQIDKVKSETKGQNIENDIQDFEREIIDVMREEGYQGTFAYARASLEEYTAKLTKQNFTNERQKYDYIREELRHNKVVNEFEESLNPKRREQFDAVVRTAVNNADIVQFMNDMKVLNFWSDKSIDVIQTIAGAIGSIKGLKVPDIETITESYTPKGDTFSKTTTKRK